LGGALVPGALLHITRYTYLQCIRNFDAFDTYIASGLSFRFASNPHPERIPLIVPGETKTLDELLARSLLNDAFVVVNVIDGVTMAAYRRHGSDQAELWQAIPDRDETPLMQFLYIIDIRDYPQSF
jgi:hypothetical protein